ncbi:T9SS-dependent M36 family metallopeptidase [Chryseobacterium koreense]|uniref:Metalloprotease n=1 Tax=Chryseobacterium koreense CCUG 49689 TaxID=1304281 RepID=A0A0J7LUV3_9FLAO|nr:T9SS-dependent M36 family metallopeptidase [Chryseobacterium koreense]KMQ72685.1 metalloprotease [Chryseobacterium koreense CCUG 49689]MBB5333089.1 hypothetical protein [Chryseobacterium koreense]
MRNRNLPLKIAAVCFLFSIGNANAQDFKSILQSHLSAKSGILKSDLKDFEITNVDYSESMKGNVIDFQQSYQGIPIYNATGKSLIKKDQIFYLTEAFAKTYANVSSPSSGRPAQEVFTKMASKINLKNSSSYTILGIKDADLDTPFVKTRPIYFQTENNDLRLAQEFVFPETGSSAYWHILADAVTGEILSKENLTISCSFRHDAYHHDYSSHNPEGFTVDFAHQSGSEVSAPKVATAAAALDATYRVFPLPVESPIHGNRALLTNPWNDVGILPNAVTDGWHTISGGTYTGSYNTTRGNNVMAYEDKANVNAPGAYADGGTNRLFDFPFVVNDTNGNLNAAITNLFYMNNKMHDIFYSLGFTETAKNFQAYNFGRGGAQNDYVMAEAQDGGGTDNANFSTPGDGSRGRMQMYLWNPSVIQRLYYNAPAEAVNRETEALISTTFGPALTATGVTADVKLSPVLDACTPLPAGSLAGKIGLIERGTCEFQAKVQAAQNAGAIGAIIYSLPDSTPTSGMGGTNPNITIPSVLIPNSEGLYMKGLITGGTTVNVTLKYDPAAQKFRDGDFDNGIVAHEYGHGISTRLVGSLSSSANKEQMGEGWSDFFALMLTNRPGDNASVPRGIGTYAISEPITGGGIRPAPYSPDMAINSYSYDDTNGMEYTNTLGQIVPDVHSIGFVWATMLWDLHWKYVEKYGYASNVMANKNSGSYKVLELVTNALKLTPTNPGFIQGRNAILAAEAAIAGVPGAPTAPGNFDPFGLHGGPDKCMIINVFAKRGLGLNASAGSPTNINDQVADWTEVDPNDQSICKDYTLATSETAVKDAMNIYPNPAKNEFFIKAGKNIAGKVVVEIYDASGKMVSNQRINPTEAVNTQNLTNGVYMVKVSGMGVNYSSKLMIKK